MTFINAVLVFSAVFGLILLFLPARPAKAKATAAQLPEQAPIVALLEIASHPLPRRLVYFIAADGARYDCSLYSGHFVRQGPALSSASADPVLPFSVVYWLLSPELQRLCPRPEQRVTYSQIHSRHLRVDLDLAELNLLPA